MERKKVALVWFKRDLRLQDHEALKRAIASGHRVVLLYCFEPRLMALVEHAPRHWHFVSASLDAMDQQLRLFQTRMLRMHRPILDAFSHLQSQFEIAALYSHQETGQEWTFRRDQSVAKWCREQNIPWLEARQDGVIRALRGREGWQAAWEDDMAAPLQHPDLEAAKWALDLRHSEPALRNDVLPRYEASDSPFQPAGSLYALRYLKGFLQERSDNYLRHLARPALARRSCSRLSPYLAYGNVSARQVFQSVDYTHSSPRRKENMEQFMSRIWWRSHYIQKLESDYRIEHQPLNRGFAGLGRGKRADWLAAWETGQTGFPMVDASMKCLEANGYLNFRMRAMLATFCAYALWQDFKPVATKLARLFLDFEPGIHFAQLQMQFGLTGYHPLRIFNPIHQARQYDPEGAFVRHWLPALERVPPPLLYEPWKMTEMEQHFYGCRLGQDYPEPLFDYDLATRKAKEEYWAWRMDDPVQNDLERVWALHCLPRDAAAYRATLEADKERQRRKKEF